MRITESEQAERKRRMIHSAYELFCKSGIDSVSVAEIAKKAHVSTNSIFRYFGTKEQLLRCTQLLLWKEIVAKILSDNDSRLHNAKNGFEEIKVLISNFQSFYKQHANYLVFSCDYKLYLIRHNLTLSNDSYNKILDPIYAVFVSALEKGHLDGSISTSETSDEQFFVLWGVMRGYVEQIVIYDRMCEAKNPWSAHFDLAMGYLLEALRSNSRRHS